MAHSHQCSQFSSPLQQTMTEMEFERGIWEPAVNGYYQDIEKFILKGFDVNKSDQAGYSALVIIKNKLKFF